MSRDRAAPSGVIYSHASNIGGAEVVLGELARVLDLSVWTFSDTVARLVAQDEVDVVVPIGLQKPDGFNMTKVCNLPRIWLAIWRQLRRERRTFVVSNTMQGVLHVGLPCLLTRTKLVVYVRDMGRGGNRGKVGRTILQLATRGFATGVVFNSDLTRKSWPGLRNLNSCVSKSHVKDVYFGGVSDPNASKLLMVGRLATWKGQHVVIEACNRLSSERDLELSIVGGAQFGEEVSLPQPKFELTMTGHDPEPWRHFRDAAIFIHASQTPEPLGQVMFQAAAAGLPIICSNRGGHMEWLEDRHSCLAVDVSDPSCIAQAIIDLQDDRELRTSIASNAKVVAESFRIENAYAEIGTWLQALLSERCST